MLKLRDGIVELYRKVAISVPKDIEDALNATCSKKTDVLTRRLLEGALKKVSFSRAGSCPICEDTGFRFFSSRFPWA